MTVELDDATMSVDARPPAPADPSRASGIGPDLAGSPPAAVTRPAVSRPRPRARARRRWRASPEVALLAVPATVFTLVIGLPVLAIFLRVLPREQLWSIAQRPV